MSMGLVFWILMLLWLVFWGLSTWGPLTQFPWGGNLLLFILLLLLGWASFGAPIH